MTESILQIKDLKKSFGDNQILKGISLDVKQGEVVVILGSSGCGKSTLLRCINGLETIQGGDILLDGKSITGSKKDFHLIRQKIGMVFQSYDLFPHLDILQNLILGPVKAQGRNKNEVIAEAEKLLDRVGLLDKKHSFARQLSGGQKQRVAIVRSLLMHPEVILFDEVTASLDPEMVREVLELINDLAQEGCTMNFSLRVPSLTVLSLWIRVSSLRKVLLKNSSIIQRHSGLKSSSMSLISVSLVPICNPLFLVKVNYFRREL